MATVTGNSLIVKPSERDPGATMIIAELCQQAGQSISLAYTLNLMRPRYQAYRQVF